MSGGRSVRRPAIAVIAALVVIAVSLSLRRAIPVLAIGAAYKAKMLCSGTFVSGRDTSAVLNDLQRDDLAILRYIPASVDTRTRSVTVTAVGLVTRRAVHRDGLGCTLVLDGFTPETERATITTGTAFERSAAHGRMLTMAASGDAAWLTQLSATIDRAFSEPESERPRRTQAVVVMHRGELVGERYAAGIGPETPLIGWSMAKSVMNALVGVLVTQGLLTLEAPVHIPEWQSPGDPRAAIALDHLLRMSSGLRFDEDMSNPGSDVMRMLLDAGDAAGLAVRTELIAAPGTTWSYSSGTTMVIARAMRNAFQNDADYLNFPRRALFDRIGMTSAVLETDAAGTFFGSSFMYATARDWARFGLLYRNDGVWNGERILPHGWVTYSTSPAPADPLKRYGAHFWLEVPDEYSGAYCRLPADSFHAAGHEGQFVTIVPSRAAVIVRLGRTRLPDAWDQCAFASDVLAALDRAER